MRMLDLGFLFQLTCALGSLCAPRENVSGTITYVSLRKCTPRFENTCSVRKCIVAYLVGTLFQVELSVSSTLQQRNSLVKFSKVNLIRPRAFAVRALLRIARRRSGPQGASSPSLCLLRLTAVPSLALWLESGLHRTRYAINAVSSVVPCIFLCHALLESPRGDNTNKHHMSPPFLFDRTIAWIVLARVDF